MNNIITYTENVFETFEERAFCAVDSLILSWFSYFRFPEELREIRSWRGVLLKELFRAEYFEQVFDELWDPKSCRKLFTALAASPRFRNISVRGYTEQMDIEKEEQFAAVSFQVTPSLCYVAFRGTDASLVGWKEDFNMAFQTPVPAQTASVQYLTEAAEHCSGRILTGGHSKGGNLAVYSAAFCEPELQERISRIFSHDGPGFLEEVMQTPGYLRISGRLEKTLPQSSIVGMLLENQEDFTIIKSSSFSLWQHDPFSWQVEDGGFVPDKQLTKDAYYLDQTVNTWIRQLTREDRERLVDTLYSILESNEITKPAEMRKNMPAILRSASQVDSNTQDFLLNILKQLAALGLKNFPELFKRH